ncbi:MAG: hypothetical protein GX998_08930 [Firmicutes bacterium]|nr:hypothetical protein [Bacillota bacterium]
MNSVRKAIEGQEDALRAVLEAAYLAIAKYQKTRNELDEKEMRRTIAEASSYCSQFKPLIPAYKRRYFDIIDSADQIGLSARDLIMTFDRAIYELHTRMERSQEERDSLGPWSKRVLEILDGRRSLPCDPAPVLVQHEGKANFITSGCTVVGGRRVGPVRVIRRDNDWASVKPGEIVACSMTSPEVVTVVDRIVGLIIEQGGLVCHAAILAREFNIPCVVGCGSFLSEIQSGQMVTLDASTGILLSQSE